MSSATRKRWAIAARIFDTQLSYSREGVPLLAPAAAGIALSPVEFLLVASAGCLALSLKAAVLDAGLPVTEVQVIASGEKALDAPARLERMQMDISVRPRLDDTQRARILAAAQRMCTVGNTLAHAPPVDIRF